MAQFRVYLHAGNKIFKKGSLVHPGTRACVIIMTAGVIKEEWKSINVPLEPVITLNINGMNIEKDPKGLNSAFHLK